jgi:membrane protein insertase Oxa1/YidC/SpoIIIJ
VIANPHNLVTFAYPGLQHLSWMRQLAHNIHLFDNTLFGVVNLSRSASGASGIYLPALVIVIASAIAQYYQSKQLLPDTGDKRSLRAIMREAGKGNQADQSEVNAAVSRSTRFILPVVIFLFTVNLASALSLYWLVGGVVAFIQQSIVLRSDETEMEALADKPSKNVQVIPEAEIINDASPATAKATNSKPVAATKVKRKKSAKRRKKS